MIKVVSVVGAGTMGSGIAYVSALAGADTRLYDPFASALHKARNYHAHTLSPVSYTHLTLPTSDLV